MQGSVAIAGAAVRWLRDNLSIINSSSEVGMFAAGTLSLAVKFCFERCHFFADLQDQLVLVYVFVVVVFCRNFV